MASTLSVNYNDFFGLYARYDGAITASLNAAFSAWLGHFDATKGNVTINVNFTTLAPGYAASSKPDGYTFVGFSNGALIEESSFAHQLIYGHASGAATATLNIDTSWLTNTFALPGGARPIYAGDDQRVFEHEMGHMLGFIGFRNSANAVVGGVESGYDSYVTGSGSSYSFVGPNAEAQWGGPVPLDTTASVYHTHTPGQTSLMSYLDEATSIQNLDTNILADTGLPILNNQEVIEHETTRLYVAAFNRSADAGGVVTWSRYMTAGHSLQDVSAQFIGSAEFTAQYGANEATGAFVTSLYQNALHRAADPSGYNYWVQQINGGMSRAQVLTGFSESEENRQAANANPNTAYASTVEAETARLYDTAFGRAADPAGFESWTSAMMSGATVASVAAQFMNSQEFVNRYGVNPTNAQLVTAFYANTLHRAPDAPGAAGWLNALQAGTITRVDMFVGFSDSPEHVADFASTPVAGASGTTGLALQAYATLGVLANHSAS